jgi:hypothetical protein
MDAAMPRKTPPPPEQTLALLNTWQKAARDAINHIGCTRGPRAAYYYADRSPWPTDATEILRARTPEVIAYLQARHALEVRVPLERIVQAADTWMTKRDRIVQSPQTLPKDPDAVRAAVDELARFSEEGLAERRRLDLDLCIAEGALWRGRFPLLAECYGKQRRFVIRRNLIAWSIWVREAFAEAIRDWPLPNEAKLPAHRSGRRGASGGWLEPVERWELAAVVFPRYVPRTDEDPKKLAIEEARRAGDLPVVLPLIGGLFDELREFVDEAVRWPQGNLQPSRTEHLLRAVNALEELVGVDGADDTRGSPRGDERPEATEPRRSWTKDEVNVAVREYGEKHTRKLEALAERINNGDATARSEARKLFGRNAIAKALGCSKAHVSASGAWRAIAEELGLKGRTPGLGRGKRIGLEIADEEKATAAHTQDKREELHTLMNEQSAEMKTDARTARRRR